jgi:hypothetical protein
LYSPAATTEAVSLTLIKVQPAAVVLTAVAPAPFLSTDPFPSLAPAFPSTRQPYIT